MGWPSPGRTRRILVLPKVLPPGPAQALSADAHLRPNNGKRKRHALSTINTMILKNCRCTPSVCPISLCGHTPHFHIGLFFSMHDRRALLQNTDSPNESPTEKYQYRLRFDGLKYKKGCCRGWRAIANHEHTSFCCFWAVLLLFFSFFVSTLYQETAKILVHDVPVFFCAVVSHDGRVYAKHKAQSWRGGVTCCLSGILSAARINLELRPKHVGRC